MGRGNIGGRIPWEYPQNPDFPWEILRKQNVFGVDTPTKIQENHRNNIGKKDTLTKIPANRTKIPENRLTRNWIRGSSSMSKIT